MFTKYFEGQFFKQLERLRTEVQSRHRIQNELKEAIGMARGRRKMLQQGDVLLIPIQTPTDEELKGRGVKRTHKDRMVLALGEVTGHQHVVEDVDVLEGLFGGEVVIVADKPTTLVHRTEADEPTGEHEDMETGKGAYLVRLQRTYVAPTVAPRESWRNE